MAKQGLKVGIVDADIYGHSVPAMLGVADSRPTQVDDLIMPVPTAERRLGDLDRHAQAAPRPGGRLARPDARPGAGADALRRLLGRPRRAAARPAARHRRRRDLARPAPAGRRGRRRHHAAGGRRRGRRARRHDGLDDAPARRRRRREHELPALPALPGEGQGPPARDLRLRRRRPGGRDAVAAVRLRRTRARPDPARPVAARGRRRRQADRRVRPDRPGGHRADRRSPTRLAGRGRGLAGMQLGLTPTSKF